MSYKKPSKKWKLFNFDTVSTSLAQENDNLSYEFIDKQPEKNTFDFEEKLTPKLVEHLAVHSQKIRDVEFWLQNNVISRKGKRNSMLLLSGPTGCGKTTTVKVLCRTMNVEISEWVNPLDKDFELFGGVGQTNQLKEFLTESKFPSLFNNKPKITLIEDFPNSIIRNPSEFVQILEKCYDDQMSVIFICTDASNTNLNLSQTLFPSEIKDKFSIVTISFNPCSVTLMKKMLHRAHILIKENLDVLKLPNEMIIDSIASSSMGDIRCAMNQFYFACLRGSEDLPLVSSLSKPGTKRKRKDSQKKVKNMIKNESLGLFHSLGRVLNPKRQEVNQSWRLHCQLDGLIDELCTQPSTFCAFLHENYLKYFGDLNDVSNASEILSLSAMFLSNWTDKGDSLLFGLWLSVLGLMVFNEHKVSKWTQIKAPNKVKKPTDNIDTNQLPIEDRSYYNIIHGNNKYCTLKLN